MSRASWSSIGSEAEVHQQFDQPFDYDPRLFQESFRADRRRNENGGNDIHSDPGTEVDSLNESLDSLDNDPTDMPDASSGQSASQPDFLGDEAEDQSNQAICRICLEFASSDTSGGESLGRLLSPCRCKGTMKYVHATCLDQWRAASARSSSAVACDQCGAPYRFRKSKFVGLATSPTLLFLVSLFLFLLLIWTVGVVATLIMDVYDQPTAKKASAPSQKVKSRSWWPWRASVWDADADLAPVEADAWSYLDADYAPGLWSYSNLMYEPAAYIKLIKEAVRSFASGDAVDAVREVVGLQDGAEAPQLEQQDPQDERGFWSSLKHEWMYGDGGLWEKSASQSAPAAVPSQDVGGTRVDTSQAQTTVASKSKSREKYDARAASGVDEITTNNRRRRKRAVKKARRSKNAQVEPQGWLNKLFVQFSVGFSLVGILSFVNLLVGASFLGPINLNWGLGRSFARMTSNGRGRNGNQEGASVASILIVLLVMIGVVRALHVVYKLVRKGAMRALSRLEAVIVDWNYDGDTDIATDDVPIATRDEANQAQQLVRHRQPFVPAADD